MSQVSREPSKPLLSALLGEPVWPPPIWLMRQAGRYLPEYRRLRATAGDFITLCTTPKLAAEVTLQPIRRFRMDGAILFSDILMLPWALGHGLRFAEGEGPVLPRLEDHAGVDALNPDGVVTAIAPILETVARVRAGLRVEGLDATSLIGFAGAPFTVACYMIEGGGSKEFVRVRSMAYGRPELFDRLMALLTDATITYLGAQIEAGAEAVMLFDSWAGVLSPALFRRHVIAPTRQIAEVLEERYPGVPLIGFPRLAGTMIAPYAAETDCDAIAMDTAADPALVARLVPPSMVLQGNLDPLALLAGGPALAEQADMILAAMRGRAFIFNLGHGIVPQTPPEHVSALVDHVRHA